MSLNRRRFIGLGSLVATGAAVFCPSVLEAATLVAPSRPLRGGLPLTTGDEAVLSFVQSYSANVRVVGASVLGRIRTSGMAGLHILAEVPNLETMVKALETAKVGQIYAEGNTLTFSVDGVEATVENLVPEAFSARLTTMTKKAGNAFAHDALAYDPATNLLSDPFAARTTGVRVVNTSFGNAPALDVAMRGVEESNAMRLPPSENFTGWKGRVLRQFSKAATSAALAQTFLQRMTVLTERVAPAAFQGLLKSRLISTALQQTFQIDAAQVVAQYKEVRATVGAQYSDAAVYLALMIGPEIQSEAVDGAATTWLQRGTRFQVVRSRRALAQAREILEKFPSLPN
jgi:hypothetical protein